MKCIFACFLLRERLLPALDSLQYLLPDGVMDEQNGRKPISRFVELLKEAIRWEDYTCDWCFHANGGSKELSQMSRVANREGLSYLDISRYVEELSQQYAWSVIPWGVNGTGLMIALISSDEAVFNMGLKHMTETAPGLLVSSYTVEQLRDKRFRGGIFSCPGESSAAAFWQYGRSCESVYALTSKREDSLINLASVEVVCEMKGYQLGPVLRRWVRIADEKALTIYASDYDTSIITAPSLDEKNMWLALQDYAGIANHVKRDPLSFGLKVLESVPWIYIPRHDDERWEIYINRDSVKTSCFLENEKLAVAPYFSHRYFC